MLTNSPHFTGGGIGLDKPYLCYQGCKLDRYNLKVAYDQKNKQL